MRYALLLVAAILPLGALAAQENQSANAKPREAHFHQVDEHVTVISGAFQVGMGDTFDEGKLTTLPPGTFGVIPPGMQHLARADKATVIQLHAWDPGGSPT